MNDRHSIKDRLPETIELKPCPFCGGNADLWIVFVPYGEGLERDEENEYHCGCCDCGVSTSSRYDEDDAIEAWNRRTDNV